MKKTDMAEDYARFIAIYGHNARDASIKRVQAFARLYAQSGWTAETLARKEHKSQRYIACLIIFGRFLLATNGGKGSPLSEKHFRDLWQRTDKTASEAARFAAVETMLADMQAGRHAS